VTIRVRPAVGADDYEFARALIREYLDALPFDVGFQQVDDELAGLEGEYGPPSGRALLGFVDGECAGFVGVRRFDGRACELKRMWVRPAHRSAGLGRRLGAEAVAAARSMGYERILLDTVRSLVAANTLYESLGFRDIEPYRYNPLAGARFLALELSRPAAEATATEPGA